jgi:hypothetical protein
VVPAYGYYSPGPQTPWTSPFSGLSLPAQASELAGRFPAWLIWYGPVTREWWALPRRETPNEGLVCAPTADVLASLLWGRARQP